MEQYLSTDKRQLLPSYPVLHHSSEVGMALEKVTVLFQGQGCIGITKHIPEQHRCDKCMK